MTSQRFLNDKVNSRDFLRSLIQGCKAPILAFFFTVLSVIGPVIVFARDFGKNAYLVELAKNHKLISYFGGATGDDSYVIDEIIYAFSGNMLCGLMMACGVVVALSLFSFIFKKNSVNVYFSMGITRVRLFANRLAAAAVELFAISVIPYLTVFLVNIGLFGYHSHQLKLFAYYTLIMFVSGMTGLATGIFASSVSGSAIEAIITAGTVNMIPALLAAVLSELKTIFLLGYVDVGLNSVGSITSFSPVFGLYQRSGLNNLIEGKSVPQGQMITWKTDVSPIVFFAVIAVILLAVSLLLFKKRRNENTASFGKYSISSALNGTVVFLISLVVSSALFAELYSAKKIKSIALCIILCTVISFIAFFIAELIIRRNIKAVVRMLPVYGGLMIASFATLLVIGTGYFGTFNKLPDAKDIEFVSMSYVDSLNFLSYDSFIYSPESYDEEDPFSCKSSNPEDIRLCIEQFNKIKSDKRTDQGILRYIEFIIKTKDGKFIARRFPVYSEEIRHNYDKAVFDSEYFHQIIKANLAKFDMIESTVDYGEGAYGFGDIISDKNYGTNTYRYFDGSLLSDNFNYSEYGFNDDEITPIYTVTEELKDALYNDLCKMTYDEYYGNNAEPVGAVAADGDKLILESQTYSTQNGWLDFYRSYYDNQEMKDKIKTCIAYSSILIYPQMTETLEQLKDVKPNPHSTAVKAVICPDKKLSISEAVENLRDYSLNTNGSNGVFASGNEAGQMDLWFAGKEIKELFAEKPQGTYLDFMEIAYNAREVNLSRVDDKEKANKIADASRMVYDTYGDNGRYIFVIYEDGCIVSKYLPEKSMSVLN